MKIETNNFLSEGYIQAKLYQKFMECRYKIMVPNAQINYGSTEADFIGIRPSGFVDEVEIKLTKTDFKADFKKTVVFGTAERLIDKHESIKDGKLHCNYFYFCFPNGMVNLDEVPEYAGVILLSEWGELRIEREARRLHSRKASDSFKTTMLIKAHHRYWNLTIKNINGKEK